jgi:hypothetical protein
MRTGPSAPVAGGTLRNTLSTGWDVAGGGRALFFNPERDAAWTLDLGLNYMYNHGGHPNLNLPLGFDTVSVKALHRTSANLAGGREWYLLAPAGANGCNWRIGADAGGRWGTSRLDLTSELQKSHYRRRNDVDGGVVLSLHTDAEIPWGACVILVGLRAEWDYIWSSIMADANLMDVNLLLNFGFRF